MPLILMVECFSFSFFAGCTAVVKAASVFINETGAAGNMLALEHKSAKLNS